MKINNADKLKLKGSPLNIINLELFARVCHTYSCLVTRKYFDEKKYEHFALFSLGHAYYIQDNIRSGKFQQIDL